MGWNVTNLGIKLGHVATRSIASGESFSISLNIPCDCHISFTVEAVPNYIGPYLPDCQEGIGAVSINVYPF